MKNLCILLMAVAFVLLDLSGCGAAQSAVESIGSLFDGGDDDEPAQEEEQNGENGDETQNAQAQQQQALAYAQQQQVMQQIAFAQPNVASQQAVAQPQQGSAEQAGPSSTPAGSAPQVLAASAPTYTQSSSSSSTTSVTTGGITTTTQTNTNNGAVTSNTTTTAAAGTSSTGSAGATSNEQSCAGDFYLGRQAYEDSSQGFGHECNSGRTNCFDGTFLETGDGRCYCVASCPSSFTIGEACSDDGSWTCQHVQATNASANHARICVPDSWNICLQ